jgi:hypothetical protein
MLRSIYTSRYIIFLYSLYSPTYITVTNINKAVPFIAGTNQPRRGNYQPGEFCFPFAFRLPPVNLPSSYHDTNGSIRYWLDSTIERPMWFNETTAVAILVMETVSVNSPELQVKPQEIQWKYLSFQLFHVSPI